MSLHFHQISHTFSGQAIPVIADISLEVQPGEIVSLFGPSGCGKTTLLRLGAGHEAVQSGAITLNGQTLADSGQMVPPEKRPVGYVFQDYVLFPHLSVRNNILFGLTHMPASQAQKEVSYRIDQLRLNGLENRFPHQLSGGQQQRVALARALARNPQALLLDEPFASLGAVLRQSLQEEMRTLLKADGVAALFVTHDPAEALLMGDRIALMQAGKIISDASAQSHYQDPACLEATSLFADLQHLQGNLEGQVLTTSLGRINIDLHLAQQGPVDVVVASTAIQLTPIESTPSTKINAAPPLSEQSRSAEPLTVIDCRFKGPSWTLFLHNTERKETIRAETNFPLDRGSQVMASITRNDIHFIGTPNA